MFLDKYDQVPFKVIRELSGNIHYGGRVTDDWDRRTLVTLLAPFVSQDTLSDDFAFSPSGIYKSVAAADQTSYIQTVNQWPLNTAPEAFGLHENADITCARADTFDMLSTILLLDGTSGVSGGGSGAKSSDDTVSSLAQSILTQVRTPFDIKAFQAKFPTKYEDSMNTVVVQEAIRFNRLINVLRTSLQNLLAAIKGLVVMSRDLELVYRALLINQVPEAWAEAAYPSLKPLAAWVQDLAQRLQMIERWYNGGHPKAHWISGFFFPQAFLTGTLQNFARKEQVSIDTVSYGFQWLNQDPDAVVDAPTHGCYVYGSFIEGARIDTATMRLAESRPKVLFESAPMVWLVPTVNRVKPATGVYDCPMYKTLRRAGTLSTTGHSTNYVLTVELNTSEAPEHWVRRGVALVCSLNY
jgi:dynein heavy chain